MLYINCLQQIGRLHVHLFCEYCHVDGNYYEASCFQFWRGSRYLQTDRQSYGFDSFYSYAITYQIGWMVFLKGACLKAAVEDWSLRRQNQSHYSMHSQASWHARESWKVLLLSGQSVVSLKSTASNRTASSGSYIQGRNNTMVNINDCMCKDSRLTFFQDTCLVDPAFHHLSHTATLLD